MKITLTQDITPSLSFKPQAQQGLFALGQGEVIRATVVSVQGEAVSLKTEDGRMFSARLAPGAVLMEHDTVELMAGESAKGEPPVLRVVFVEQGQSEIAAREPAGVQSKAVLTKQLAEAFQQMNLKPTPKLVSLASEILKNYPVDAKTAAFFAANSIPATKESIQAFENILAGKQFGAAFFEIAQDVASALGQIDPAASSAAAMQAPLVETDPAGALGQHAIDPSAPTAPDGQSGTPARTGTGIGFSGQVEQAPHMAQQENMALYQAGERTPPEAGQAAEMAGRQAQGQSPVQPQVGEHLPRSVITPGASVIQEEGVAAGIAGEPTFAQAEGAGIYESAPVSEFEMPAPALGGEKDHAIRQGDPLPQQAKRGPQHVQQPQEEDVLLAGRAVQPQQEQTDNMRPAGGVRADIADGLAPKDSWVLPDSGVEAQEIAHSPYTTKGEEKEILKDLLDLFIKAGEDIDAQTLKKSVEETPQKLLELQKLIKNTDIHTQETLASRFQELTAQAKLAEDISRFVFVQIPIHLKEYGSAELYVYKRNRREKGAERQSTCVVLGLSTQNLGRVEAMLRIENRDISLELRVQNEDALTAFRGSSGELQQSLTELRYQLKEYKVAPLRERTTPLNAEEKLVRMYSNSGAGLDVMI